MFRGRFPKFHPSLIAAAIALICPDLLGAAWDSATLQVATTRVVLSLVAATGAKEMADLGPDDFVVEEGGRSREVVDVHVADYPVVVLVDDAGTNLDTLAAIRSAVAHFIGRIGERPVALGGLSRPDVVVADFTDDRATVLKKLDAVAATSTPPLAVDAARHAAQVIREAGTPFSAVVIVSDQALDPGGAPSNDLLKPILDSGAVVHVVGRRHPGGSDGTPAGDLLKRLADQTRGQYTAIYSAASYSAALERLAERLGSEVMVTYLVGEEPETADVRVGLKVPGARVVGLGVSK
jgi:hypothetical protein